MIHAAATCTYRISSRSPMSRSGGDVTIATVCDATRNRNANAPNHGQRPWRGGSHEGFGSLDTIVDSGLDHMFEEEVRDHKKDEVIRDKKLHPRARLVHHVAGEERPRGFDGGQQHGDEH